jgi:hypothetical protein
MALTRADASEIMKEFYLPTVREQLNNAVDFLTLLEKTDENVQGEEVVFSAHVGRNQGTGARSDGRGLPTAGKQKHKKARTKLKRLYQSIEIDAMLFKLTNTERGAFVSALEDELKGAVTDIKVDTNRQCFGTSDGVIVATAVSTATTTINLAAATPKSAIRQLQVDMVIDIGTVATPDAVASARTILSVDRTYGAAKIVISGANVTTATTDRVFRTGNGGDGDDQAEITGLQTLVDDDSELFGIDPADYDVWASTVYTSSEAPSEDVFAVMLDDVYIASGEEVDAIMTTPGVSRNYANSLTSQKQFVNEQKLTGGYSGLAIQSGRGVVPLMWDRDCPDKHAFGIAKKHLIVNHASDWNWMEEDGAVLARVPGDDFYSAELYRYMELTLDRRNAFAVHRNLTEA